MAEKMTYRLRMAGVLIAALLCLTGCGQLEIEERSFPLALAVTPAETQGSYDFTFFFEEMESAGSSLYHKDNVTVTASGYAQAYTKFGRMQPASPDDSHMQVILMSEELLQEQAFLDSFYNYAMKQHHFSWNTMVYLMENDTLEEEKLADHTGEHPGSYFMAMARSDEQEKTAGVPTLGDLYMERQNCEKVLLLPVLGDELPPYVDHYRLLVCGQEQQSVDPDTARLIQLLQGKLGRLQLELADGTMVELQEIRNRRSYLVQEDRWCVTIHAGAVVQNRLELSQREQKKIRQESIALLQKRLSPLTMWAPVKAADGQLVQPKYEIDLQMLE